MSAEPIEQFEERPVEVRAATTEVADVNVSDRVITVIAVPYDEPAKIGYRGSIWTEMFSRGAFDGIEKRPQRVRVNREHVIGDTIGKAITFHPSREEGLVAELRIAKTLRGDETLALAEDDCLSSSIGFSLAAPSDQLLDRATMTRRINRAWLDHIALVESPAYAGSDVLDVRDAVKAMEDMRAPLATPVLDDFLTDPLIRRALGLE